MNLDSVDQPRDSDYEKLPFLRTLCPFQRNFVQREPLGPVAVLVLLAAEAGFAGIDETVVPVFQTHPPST
jgi:hypothetical protein